MNASGLPARIGYTVVALPLAAVSGFYSSINLLPKLAARWPEMDPGMDGQGFFDVALGVGAVMAFSAALFALTLPWKRHRKRRGRPWRIGLSCALVVIASAGFAAEIHRLAIDLVFATWLAYTMAYTFVRYGVIDQTGRRSGSRGGYL